MIKASRYALFGKNIYHKRDREFRGVYLTSAPRLFFLPANDVALMEDHKASEISSLHIDKYIETGIVTYSTPEAERLFSLQRISNCNHSRAKRVFALMPTSLCNMCCDYCGQQTCPLRYDSTITADVIQRIYSTMLNRQVKEVEVRWYGGEPLMAFQSIKKMSSQLMEYAQETGTQYRATMSTNGSLMTAEKLSQLYHDMGLRSLTVTIDGFRDFHNTSRKTRSGRATYDYILDWISYFAQHVTSFPHMHVAIRVNITKHNAISIPYLISDLKNHKLDQAGIELQLIPVYDWGHSNGDLQLDNDSLNESMIANIRQALHSGIFIRMLQHLPVEVSA